MRPRVFPAEDRRIGRVREESWIPSCFNEAAGIPRGRPEAQGQPSCSHGGSGFNEAAGIPRGRPSLTCGPRNVSVLEVASMRPRVFPAEDTRRHLRRGDCSSASMRPRVFPAEDHNPGHHACGHNCRFNEAAGIPRGRRQYRRGRGVLDVILELQ